MDYSGVAAEEFLGANGFSWNDHYICFVVPGQTYSGVLVGRDGAHCLVLDGERRLLVGWGADLPEAAVNGEPVRFTATAR